MDGTRSYHPEWGNPVTKEHTWYALTDKWILAQESPEYPIPKKQFTEIMKFKKKGKNGNVSVLLR